MCLNHISGTYPAIVTPMQAGDGLSNPVDYEAVRGLLDYVISRGCDGVVVAGCTGQSSCLGYFERLRLVEDAIDYLGSSIKVIAGDGANSTADAIGLACDMRDCGARYHLQISPCQVKPEQNGIFEHYSRVARALDDDGVILYNVPSRTGRNVDADTVIRLAEEHSNIIGVKEASGNMDQIRAIIDGTRDFPQFALYSGDDNRTLEIIRAGGQGVISVAGNVDPLRVSGMVNAALAGDYLTASEIDRELEPLYRALFLETNPSPVHYALNRLGLSAGVPRLPLTEVSDTTKEAIDEVLLELGLVAECPRA